MNKSGNHKTIKLHGIATRGLSQSSLFTEIPWVKKQFIEKLGITAYPGTFNITVADEDSGKLNIIKEAQGIEIEPEDKSFCVANGFPVLIDQKIKGAAIIPLVADYPPNQLEIISATNIKQSLGIKDGDLTEVEVYL